MGVVTISQDSEGNPLHLKKLFIRAKVSAIGQEVNPLYDYIFLQVNGTKTIAQVTGCIVQDSVRYYSIYAEMIGETAYAQYPKTGAESESTGFQNMVTKVSDPGASDIYNLRIVNGNNVLFPGGKIDIWGIDA